jgi:phosphate transport system substrate-binding protein
MILAILLLLAVFPSAAPAQPVTKITGAGATFPYPIYTKWFETYQRRAPSVEFKYDAVGSEAGIRSLLRNHVDFGASDNPEILRELAPHNESDDLFFPSVLGAVVPIINLPGFGDNVAFTPEALAGIYLGKITKWNDPVLVRANRGRHLPNLDIVVIHRSDGSGTTYAWTDYLSKTNAEWKTRTGAGLSPKWPAGWGAIGYVEFIYALQNHLSFGKVRNQKGEFVAASLESIAAAATNAMEPGSDFKVSIADAPGAGSYPIASFTWLVIPAHIADNAKRTAIAEFLQWMLGSGQKQAAVLGYLPLPQSWITKERAAIARIQ